MEIRFKYLISFFIIGFAASHTLNLKMVLIRKENISFHYSLDDDPDVEQICPNPLSDNDYQNKSDNLFFDHIKCKYGAETGNDVGFEYIAYTLKNCSIDVKIPRNGYSGCLFDISLGADNNVM